MKKLILLSLLSITFCSCTNKIDKPSDEIHLDRETGLKAFEKYKKEGKDSLAIEQLVSLFKMYGFESVYSQINGLDNWAKSNNINLDSLKTIAFDYNKKIDDIVSSSKSFVTSEDANPCVMSEDFIKKDLRYPETAEFSNFDCTSEYNSDGSYTVLRKVIAQNGFGVKSSYIYKIVIGFKGGNTVNINDWELVSIKSEEYR